VLRSKRFNTITGCIPRINAKDNQSKYNCKHNTLAHLLPTPIIFGFFEPQPLTQASRQTMEPSVNEQLERVARDFLGSRAWSVDIVLRVGAELAQCVNKMKSLSGRQKADAVLQTIQRLLDDAEKAEKALREESTATTKTTIPWEELKMVAKDLLPVALDLMIDAARGRLDLKKVESAVKVGCALAPWLCCGKKATSAEVPSQLVIRQVSQKSANPLLNATAQPPLAQDTQVTKKHIS
jgi:hypothetical protein